VTGQRPDFLIFEGEELRLEGIPHLPKDALQIPTGRRALVQRSALSLASRLSALTNEDDFLFLTGRCEPPDAARSEPGDPGPAKNAELLRALEAGGCRLTESWHRDALRIELERSLVSTLEGLNRELQPESGDEPPPLTAIDDCSDPEVLVRRLDLLSDEMGRRNSRTEHRKSAGLDESTALEPATRAELVAETIRALRFVPFRYGGGPGAINTSCYRGYIATWEVRDDRLLLVKIDGHPSFYPDEPLVADWISGGLVVPRGEVVHRFDYGIELEYIHSSYSLFMIANGHIESVKTVSARERFPDLDERVRYFEDRKNFDRESRHLRWGKLDALGRPGLSEAEREELEFRFEHEHRRLKYKYRAGFPWETIADPDDPGTAQ